MTLASVLYVLVYTLVMFFIVSCGKQTQGEKATTPEVGVVKLICQCQKSFIQGQGSSKPKPKAMP